MTTEYIFEFGGHFRNIAGGAHPIYTSGTPCKLTGNYNTVYIDGKTHRVFEVVYKPKNTLLKVDKPWYKLLGLTPKYKVVSHPETTKWVSLDDLHCRAVINETFACIN